MQPLIHRRSRLVLLFSALGLVSAVNLAAQAGLPEAEWLGLRDLAELLATADVAAKILIW